MPTLVPFLMFPGNCREALEHYRECLDADITRLVTFGEAPVDFPPEHAELVYNAELRAGDLRLRASDNPHADAPGSTTVALFAAFPDRETLRRAFDRLAVGGEVVMPLEGGFGMVADRYGFRWMLGLED
jgi:PhnB protein